MAFGVCTVVWDLRTESFRLEKPSKIIEFNHYPSLPKLPSTCVPRVQEHHVKGADSVVRWLNAHLLIRGLWAGPASSWSTECRAGARQMSGTGSLPLLNGAWALCSVLQSGCYCLIVNLLAPQGSSIWRICLKFTLRGQKNVPRLQLAAHQAWRGVWWFINLSLSKRCTFFSNTSFQGMSNNKGKLERKKNYENAGWQKNWGLNTIPRFPVCKLYPNPAFLGFSWLRQLWSSRGFSDHPAWGQVPRYPGCIWSIANQSLKISPTLIPNGYGKIEMQGFSHSPPLRPLVFEANISACGWCDASIH